MALLWESAPVELITPLESAVFWTRSATVGERYRRANHAA
jgi:hypothetical protein